MRHHQKLKLKFSTLQQPEMWHSKGIHEKYTSEMCSHSQ
jgi:hypothetical protein